MSEAGEASLVEVATSVSPQAPQKHLASLGGGDPPRALGTGNLSGDAIPKATVTGAKGKVPKKIIAKRVRGSVKWLNVKNGYGFISRHDTQEGVFVHQTAIPRNNPHKYERGVGDVETVEFHVVQGERSTEATNGAEHDVDEGEDSGEGFTAAQGLRRCLPGHHQDQRPRRFPPCRRAPAVTRHPSILATTSGPRPGHLPGSTRPEGDPRQRRGPSYLLSRPRGRGTTLGPRPSPGISAELEAEHRESGRDAGGDLQ
ncbi:Y-box-binding protein 3-like [Balaenoptera acutorostrata]|uniref:Y-box-binding protein 3-like n=1 Tax=Balaenoptera acutorostrata TaxID=9767 RepID=A0ABM3SUV2_BALAC|nr:Y-box-binding protein 3-like [Balaenoptera acutorostrata]